MEKINATLAMLSLPKKQNGSSNKKLENLQFQKLKKVIVSTIAGDGTAGFLDGLALNAKFKSPIDVAVLPNGVVYVADAFNSCIRKVQHGMVTTFAGNGNANITNGNGSEARFKIPNRLALDVKGNLYLLDAADPRIRKITPVANVYTYAGAGIFGFKDGDAINAEFGQSFGIVTDQQGNVYVADSQNDSIRKISLEGAVTTIVGATIKHFHFVSGIAINNQGDLFVSDVCRIKKISPAGIVSAFAGNYQKGYVDGKGQIAMFSQIEDLVMDQQENIYVTDENRIRKITSRGTVSTIAGGLAGYKDGDAATSQFDGPRGLTLDLQGNIYVADFNNKRIRKISFE